ncbi:MAG: DUF3786 domain-containing protein [Carboxydocellales bacterium]
MCNERADLEAKKLYLTKDVALQAQLAGGVYDSIEGSTKLYYCGQMLTILRDGNIVVPNQGISLTKKETVAIWHYLSGGTGLPLGNTWLSFQELPNGMLHYGMFQKEALQPLEKSFNNTPSRLLKAIEALGGESFKLGDYGGRIPVFPKLSLVVGIWLGDEEFPTKATMLFENTTVQHMTTPALYVLGIEIALRICREGGLLGEGV